MVLPFVLIASAGAIIFYNTPIGTQICNTVLYRPQASGDVDITAFGKNYSLVYDATNCCSATSGRKDQIVKVFTDWPCYQADQQRIAQAAGYGGVFNGGFTGDYSAQNVQMWTTERLGIPYFYSGTTLDQLQKPLLNGYTPCYRASGNPANITIYLDVGTMSPMAVELQAGTSYRLTYVGIALGWLTILVGIVKLTLTIFTAGKVSLSVPQLVLSFVILTGFFVQLAGFYEIFGVIGYQSGRVAYFFELWAFCTSYSALLTLGLYFKEVSMLTKSGGSATLEVMKWPCVVVLALLWSAIIVNSFLQTTVPPGGFSNYGNFQQYVLSIFCLVCAVLLFFCVWGCGSLLLSMDRNSKMFRSVLLIVICYSASVVIAITSGLIYLTTSYFIGVDGTNPIDDVVSIIQYQWTVECLMFICPPAAMIIICFIFRVSVSKEIELSKSGTSSTSGRSGSGSSSSSSASSDFGS